MTSVAPNFPTPEAVLNRRVKINVTQWRLVQERVAEVESVLSLFPEEVTRNDIIRLRCADQAIRRRRVVIASLMWGTE
ncbi:MAG: hypothetical protein ABSA72_13500 [Nitrososphaerales archaeon]